MNVTFEDSRTGERLAGQLLGRLIMTDLAKVQVGDRVRLVNAWHLRTTDLQIGETYEIPSGMGGTFTARLLSLTDTDGSFRVISSVYPEWDGYLVTVARTDIRPRSETIPTI
jgi:hypothetical protein